MSYRSSPSYAVGGICWNTETWCNIVPPWGWACFHCGETFPGTWKGQRDAGLHFGEDSKKQAACRGEE